MNVKKYLRKKKREYKKKRKAQKERKRQERLISEQAYQEERLKALKSKARRKAREDVNKPSLAARVFEGLQKIGGEVGKIEYRNPMFDEGVNFSGDIFGVQPKPKKGRRKKR